MATALAPADVPIRKTLRRRRNRTAHASLPSLQPARSRPARAHHRRTGFGRACLDLPGTNLRLRLRLLLLPESRNVRQWLSLIGEERQPWRHLSRSWLRMPAWHTGIRSRGSDGFFIRYGCLVYRACPRSTFRCRISGGEFSGRSGYSPAPRDARAAISRVSLCLLTFPPRSAIRLTIRFSYGQERRSFLDSSHIVSNTMRRFRPPDILFVFLVRRIWIAPTDIGRDRVPVVSRHLRGTNNKLPTRPGDIHRDTFRR